MVGGPNKSTERIRLVVVAACIKAAYSRKKENKIEIVELSEHALRGGVQSDLRAGVDVHLVARTNLSET